MWSDEAGAGAGSQAVWLGDRGFRGGEGGRLRRLDGGYYGNELAMLNLWLY